MSEPGSAIAGQPASDNKPIDFPSLHASRKLYVSSSVVYLFNS
jgi:hypothetical protein